MSSSAYHHLLLGQQLCPTGGKQGYLRGPRLSLQKFCKTRPFFLGPKTGCSPDRSLEPNGWFLAVSLSTTSRKDSLSQTFLCDLFLYRDQQGSQGASRLSKPKSCFQADSAQIGKGPDSPPQVSTSFCRTSAPFRQALISRYQKDGGGF